MAKSPSLGVGAHFGYAGLLYFLAHYKAVAQDYDVDKTVSILFSLLSDAVKDDCKFDMTHGVTGCLAAIQSASLYGFQDKVNVLSERCVMHLLTGFSDPAVNPLTHATYQNKSLLGFAHGLSGMHWAVRQCYPLALTREIRHWLGKVENTLRAGFSTRYNHWPNFSKGPEHFSSYWCHGMAGFACANLSQKDNALALKTVRTHGLCHQSHNLCHGNAGNMDVLLSHNVLTADDAQAWLQGVQHALKSGQAFDGCNGLMVGKSGLAYALLRFLHPQDVPSALKLDQPIKPS